MRESNYVQVVRTRLEELLSIPDELMNIYVVLVFTKGLSTTMEDVHDAWSVWQNVTRPDHPALIPFDQLPEEKQELDRQYMEAIHSVALNIQTVKQ